MSGQGSDVAADDAARLLAVIRSLTLELAPERSRVQITLDTDLDRELGFDSLSRVELLLRIERGLDVRLSESLFSSAETPRDLLRAVTEKASRAAQPPPVEPVMLGDTAAVPDRVDTLTGVLQWRADRQPERTHVLLYEADAESPFPISYAELLQGAERLAAGLLERGLEPARSVAVMLPTGRQYLEAFFGVLLAGGVPVPIYPPARPSQLEDHLRRHAKILDNAGAGFLITVPEGRAVGRLLKRQVGELRAVITPEELLAPAAAFSPVPVQADDVALLQYTSGSTGQPKGVVLSHADLLANIRAMGTWVDAGPDDVFVSWLPLYHDMGLIGGWLGSLYYAMLSVLMPPTAFLTRPRSWLWAIHQHRGTISAAPNFAYELCLGKIRDSEIEGLDLSSWRLAFNGAEPVSPRTLRRFGERFARYGFSPSALSPVYGLAECGVGLAFPPSGRGPTIDRIQRDPFERSGRALPATADEPALEVVACGQPLGGYEIRIVDDAGREIADGTEGRVEFRGPSATRGYIANSEATAKLFDGDWLDSGDLGYVRGGDVYLTGRIKDVIIRAGRNIYPFELEEAIGKLDGIRKGCVAVFGSAVSGSEIEKLVVVAEIRQADPDTVARLRGEIDMLATDILGIAPDDVLLAPPRTVLKTSSGKIRRAACRELYEQGTIGQGPRAAWWQVVRLWLVGLKSQLRRNLRLLADLAYVGYVYLLLAAILPAAFMTLAVRPLQARWRSLGACARLLLRLAGIALVVRGDDRPRPDSRCVLVANHASYLDGLVIVAAMRVPVSFVVKAELGNRVIPRWVLGRLGAQFVERFDAGQGSADARRLAARAGEGTPLWFFPEGTFTRYPGLLAFHLGAFIAATDNALPVVPVTIRGSRSVLRADDWFPRRGPIAVIFGEPITPEGADWDAALSLRNRARQEILRHCGERDLALERGFG